VDLRRGERTRIMRKQMGGKDDEELGMAKGGFRHSRELVPPK